MKTLFQFIDRNNKTYRYSDSIPITKNYHVISKPGFYIPEKDLKERGYTNLGKSLEMLRQMGKVIDF